MDMFNECKPHGVSLCNQCMTEYVRSLGRTGQSQFIYTQSDLDAAVAAEREACAEIADQYYYGDCNAAFAIRARGAK